MSPILLQGGTVLTHDAEDHVRGIEADVLIEGKIISKIAKGINPPANAKVVDCRNKILSPGFVNTHLHTWETQLKGRIGDGLILDYMVNGVLQGYQYTPKDAFWGNLAGCLEQIDGGTTTIVESVHIIYSPEHAWNALSGTVSSGVRSMFGYMPTPRLKSAAPFELDQDLLPPWVMSTLVDIAESGPYADDRVKIAFNFDSPFLPEEVVKGLFDTAKKAGIDYYMSHYVNTCVLAPYYTPESTVPALLEKWGVLNDKYLIIHATNPTEKDAEILRRTKAPISSCPTSEYQLAQGEPVCFEDKWGLQKQCSLGIDVHNNNTSYMPSEMRVALTYTRGKFNTPYIDAFKQPRKINHTVEEAFNLGTIQGARAANLGDKIGSLAEGKLADIVVFDANSPSMICGAQQDPVAAIVMHSSPADVEMVIVDGVIRKENGKLLPVELDERGKAAVGSEDKTIAWNEIAKNVLKSRQEITDKINKVGDLEVMKVGAMAGLGVNPANIVDTL